MDLTPFPVTLPRPASPGARGPVSKACSLSEAVAPRTLQGPLPSPWRGCTVLEPLALGLGGAAAKCLSSGRAQGKDKESQRDKNSVSSKPASPHSNASLTLVSLFGAFTFPTGGSAGAPRVVWA